MKLSILLPLLLVSMLGFSLPPVKTNTARKPEINHWDTSIENREYQQWIKEKQSGWIGVKAPEPGANAVDHMTTPIRLADYRGRRVLLYGFYGGNFNYEADEPKLHDALRTLHRARISRHGRLAVIGFTSSMELYPQNWGRTDADIEPELRQLTRFPLVLNLNRDFPPPYDPVLKVSAYGGWGAILIDQNGIILRIYNAPLTPAQVREVFTMPDWTQPPRRPLTAAESP
ncbi:MAG: hypothetical protein ACR2IE_19860 [Candidatus Sumerlaeaceae bacterium]